MCYRHWCDYSSHTQIQNNHKLVGQTADSHSTEPFHVIADKRLNSCFYFSHSHLCYLLLLLFHICSLLDPPITIFYSQLATLDCGFCHVLCSHCSELNGPLWRSKSSTFARQSKQEQCTSRGREQRPSCLLANAIYRCNPWGDLATYC